MNRDDFQRLLKEEYAQGASTPLLIVRAIESLLIVLMNIACVCCFVMTLVTYFDEGFAFWFYVSGFFITYFWADMRQNERQLKMLTAYIARRHRD
jgi:hypothetical protein